MSENNYLEPIEVKEPDDRVRAIIRTHEEGIKYEFMQAYFLWVSTKEPYKLREEYWERYCLARDRMFPR